VKPERHGNTRGVKARNGLEHEGRVHRRIDCRMGTYKQQFNLSSGKSDESNGPHPSEVRKKPLDLRSVFTCLASPTTKLANR